MSAARVSRSRRLVRRSCAQRFVSAAFLRERAIPIMLVWRVSVRIDSRPHVPREREPERPVTTAERKRAERVAVEIQERHPGRVQERLASDERRVLAMRTPDPAARGLILMGIRPLHCVAQAGFSAYPRLPMGRLVFRVIRGYRQRYCASTCEIRIGLGC